jgi:DnaJ-class molecular chaperone
MAKKPPPSMIKCPACNGRGFGEPRMFEHRGRMYSGVDRCARCEGRGRIAIEQGKTEPDFKSFAGGEPRSEDSGELKF